MARLLAALAALALLEQAQPGITATSATSALLGPSMYRPLAPGAIAPHGWLLTQLKLQANGMAGHYAMFWEDVAQSWWVGGSDGDTSSAPYWLNGFVPLAYQLKAAGIEQLPPTKCTARSDSSDSSSAHRHVGSGEGGSAMPVGPVRPLDQVKTYVDGILKRVGTDGWIGPPVNGNGDVYYVATNVAFSLIQWAEAENVIGNAQPLRNALNTGTEFFATGSMQSCVPEIRRAGVAGGIRGTDGSAGGMVYVPSESVAMAFGAGW